METMKEMVGRWFGFTEELEAANAAVETAQEQLSGIEEARDEALREQARAFELERDTLNADHVARIEALNRDFDVERVALVRTFEKERDELTEEVEKARQELLLFHADIRDLRMAVQSREDAFARIMDESEDYSELIESIEALTKTFAERGHELRESAVELEAEGSEISVLALKSAMSAAALGEEAGDFAKTCDDIRTAAESYEAAAGAIKNKAVGLDDDVEKTLANVRALRKILNVREARLQRYLSGES